MPLPTISKSWVFEVSPPLLWRDRTLGLVHLLSPIFGRALQEPYDEAILGWKPLCLYGMKAVRLPKRPPKGPPTCLDCLSRHLTLLQSCL